MVLNDIRSRCTLLALAMFSAIASYPQSTTTSKTDQLAGNLQEQVKNSPKESIYLQTSKGIYETGEDLWFKAYVLDAQYFVPSGRSKILYVQLIEDRTGKAVWEEKYEIEKGFVNGHLFLDASLQSGSYTLAAYSAHAFKSGPKEFYALRKLQILENITQKAGPSPIKKDSILYFTSFAEGGNLVSGLQNRIAFKAVTTLGLPAEVSGMLYENNVPLLEFNSTHAGMGSFIITPDHTKKYHIQLKAPHGDKIYQLPDVLSSGTLLQLLTNTTDYATFRVIQTPDLKNKTVYLRLQVRGVVYNIAMSALDKEVHIKVPLKDVPQGIAEVTLFNQYLEPVAERLVYLHQDKCLNIKMTPDKGEYNTREKTTLRIKIADDEGKPVVAHLGLSVYDRLYQNTQDSKNILSHYYLSSQLKGKIYNPAYYFNTDNGDRKAALNLLMLTQGWRQYVWNATNLKVHKNKTHPLLSDSLVGQVRLERNTKKAQESPQFVTAFTADTLKGRAIIPTDTKGRFYADHNYLKLGEQGYVYVKPMTPEKPKYVIDIKDTRFETISTHDMAKTKVYPLPGKKTDPVEHTRPPFIVPDKVNKLEGVVLTPKKKKKVFRDKYLGTLDSLAKLDINPDDYVCTAGYLNCEVHEGSHGNTKPVEGVTYDKYMGFRWVNGIGGAYTIGGRTKVKYQFPKFTEAELLKKFNLKMIKGFYGKREFYQPVYDKETVKDPFPDYRNTLFWKPDIITNAQGEATVEFFCSDINTKFLAVIEGVTGEGFLGVGTFEFRVH